METTLLRPIEFQIQTPSNTKLLSKIAVFIGVLGLFLIIASYVPSVYFSLRSDGGRLVSEYLLQTAQNVETQPAATEVKDEYQPPFDSDLPAKNEMIINSIGLSTTINEAVYDNYEDALKKGVWRVSNFGTPYGRSEPTILVAHRFGYLSWSNLFRRKNSFYNLPKLKVGDTIEIIWRQRKYTYAVYAESEGNEIEDYSADLILYTCRDLTSDVRIFKYARLLEI
jgi:sortase (surface protein transpeptidase)